MTEAASGESASGFGDSLFTEADLDRAELQRHADEPMARPELRSPPKLSLDSVKVRHAVFQLRDQGHAAVSDKLHVEDLVKEIGFRPDAGLDPIVVFWSGREWTLIDGHHRLEAYRRSDAWGGKPVPVDIFEGTLDDAIREATRLNSKISLELYPKQRMDAAWRLVCLGDYSEDEFMEAAGVSRRSFFNMKSRLRKILAAFPDRSPASFAEYRWAEVKSAAFTDEKDAPAPPEEDFERKQAEELKRKLLRACGDRLTRQPEVFAMAIRMVNRGLPQMLMESYEWSDIRDDLLAGWTEEGNNPDFYFKCTSLGPLGAPCTP